MPSSYFGITGELGLYLDLFAYFLFVIWLALIAWTYVDAKRRIVDPLLVGCATTVSLYPYVGTLVYALLRPPELLRDACERELGIRASIFQVKRLEEAVCLNCEHPIQATYQRCPKCRTRVKDPCRRCGKLVDRRWSFCPYCDTLAPPVPPAKRVRLDRPPFGSSSSARTSRIRRGGRGSQRQPSASRRQRPSHGPWTARGRDGQGPLPRLLGEARNPRS
jgi:RNA polymerase subunit RPABC4/transcription elongation factor Spt4